MLGVKILAVACFLLYHHGSAVAHPADSDVTPLAFLATSGFDKTCDSSVGVVSKLQTLVNRFKIKDKFTEKYQIKPTNFEVVCYKRHPPARHGRIRTRPIELKINYGLGFAQIELLHLTHTNAKHNNVTINFKSINPLPQPKIIS